MSAAQLSPAIPLAVFRLLAGLSLVGIAMQFFLAGMTVFGAGSGWDAHAATGGAVGLPILLLFLMSFLPALREQRRLASLLFALYVLQLTLAGLGHGLPLIGALHPVNGLLLGLAAAKLTLKRTA
jgi:hypothetical protein